MEFVSELSEIEYCNSFKWKINVWPITKVLYDCEDVFRYTIRSEIMYFSEINAKWSVNITEIPYFEFEEGNSAFRYFKADFKIIPFENSFNEIFSFELRVQHASHYKGIDRHCAHTDQIKFKLLSDEACIALEAFCRVRKMVTTTRQVADESYYEEAIGQEFSDQGSFYESMVEDPVGERNLNSNYGDGNNNNGDGNNNNNSVFTDSNRQSENFLEDDFDYLVNLEDISMPANQDSVEFGHSSSDNSSWEKIEESLQEELFEQEQDTLSSTSVPKSEAGTDYACLESLPDEEETICETSQQSCPLSIDDLVIGSNIHWRSSTDLLKLPFFNQRNATLTESTLLGESNFATDIVQDRIQRKLFFTNFNREMAGGVDAVARQPLVVQAEVHQNATSSTTADAPEINCDSEEADVFNFKDFEDEIERNFQKMYSSQSSSESSVDCDAIEKVQVEEEENQEPYLSSPANERGGTNSPGSSITFDSVSDDADDQSDESESSQERLVKRISRLHHDQLKTEAENMAKLYILGAKFNFPSLVGECCLQLADLITSENYLKVWNVAEKLNNEQLKTRVVDYMVHNRHQLVGDRIPQDLFDRLFNCHINFTQKMTHS